MKLFVDDIRNPSDSSWVIARTYKEAIAYLKTGNVCTISLDHDLGSKKTGYDIACYIEQEVTLHSISCPAWLVHSANPVGKANIINALRGLK